MSDGAPLILQSNLRKFEITEDKGAEFGLDSIEALHIAALFGMTLFTYFAAFEWMGKEGFGLAALLALGSMIALILARTLKFLIGDLYRQFQYREKFALFLIHLSILLFPRYVLGIHDWLISFSVLLIVLCAQAINNLFYARIYALSIFMIFYVAFMGSPAPPSWIIAVWMFFALAAIRFGHIRVRMERFGKDGRVDARELLLNSIPVTLGPAIVSWFYFLLFHRYLSPRSLKFEPGAIQRDGQSVFISPSRIILDAFFLCLMIIVGLVILNMIDKKFRGRKKSTEIVDGIGDARATRKGIQQAVIPDLSVESSGGARERILKSFSRFAGNLKVFGYGRKDPETALEFLERYSKLAGGGEDVFEMTSIFNRACYDIGEMDDDEAERFEAALKERLLVLREKHEKTSEKSKSEL